MELLTFKQGLFLGLEMGFIVGIMVATILLRDHLK